MKDSPLKALLIIAIVITISIVVISLLFKVLNSPPQTAAIPEPTTPVLVSDHDGVRIYRVQQSSHLTVLYYAQSKDSVSLVGR